MKNIKELLEIKKRVKKNKPKYIRQDAHKKKRVSKKWRKPKGIQSKMRLKRKGYRQRMSSGYRSPKLVKNLNKEGLKEIRVHNIKDLENVKENENQGIVISKRVGIKKKVEILKRCKELKLRVLNVKNSDLFIKTVEDKRKKKKEIKKEKTKEKDKKKKEREKLAKEKEEKEKKTEEKKDKEITEDLGDKLKRNEEEEKKQKEKEEKDKVLTRRK